MGLARPEMGEVLVGVCSWANPALLGSGWYPANASTTEARLEHYATQFPLLEVDSTYYTLPVEKAVTRWLACTPDHFCINVKAYAPLAQNALDVRGLPPVLRARLPKNLQLRRFLSPRETPLWLNQELWMQFRAAVQPLYEASKLGVVLLQFPPSFRISRANRDYIAQARKWLPDFDLAVEFRHISWMQERSRQETLDYLQDQHMVYVCGDGPVGTRSSTSPVVAVTNPHLGMLRLNRDTWTPPGRQVNDQSNYRYSITELKEWLLKVKELAAVTARTHVLFDNSSAHNSVINAKEFSRLLSG